MASGSLVNIIHQEKSLYYVCRPVFPPVLKRDDGNVRGRASIFGSWRQSREWVRLTLCLLTSTGNCAICSVPIPSCPLKRLQMYSAPICHFRECGGVSSYVPTFHCRHHTSTTRGFSPAWGHPTPLLQFYTFSVMDNNVVALFSLLWQPHSCINNSFSCISFMCLLASRRSFICTGELNMTEFIKQNFCLN